MKRRVSTWFSVRLFNPLVRAAVDGDTVWIVAEHGRRASYVRNLEAHPRVRIQVRRRWRDGVAAVVPDDDPRERLRMLPSVHAASVRAMGSDLLTVRIDLENEKDAKAAA